jgi:site-specific DNA recombinase
LSDDGYSGFLDVYRPAFETALGMIARGEVSAFVGWHADRITRQVEVTARLWRQCEAQGVALHTALGGQHEDPDSLYFETMIAERASRQMRNRMLAKHEEIRDMGGFTGGQRRFGYTGTKPIQVIESEATLIRGIAQRILTGETLASIARSLNAAGVPTVRGGDGWGPTNVRSLILNPRLIGVRVFEGERLPSAFPAILDEPTFLAVGAYLGNPERRTTDGNAGKARHLLTGIAVCDMCSAPVGGFMRGGGPLVYRCTGCKGFERRGEDIDAMVGRYVVRRLTDLDENGLFASDSVNRDTAALLAERDAKAAEREELAGLLAAGDLDPAGYAAGTRAITARESAIESALTTLSESVAAPKRALAGATGPRAAAVWAEWGNDTTGAGLARRRAVIRLLVDVRIGRAGKGWKGAFNESTVSVEYRDMA